MTIYLHICYDHENTVLRREKEEKKYNFLQIKYDFPLNKVYIKYDLHVITSPKYHFLCEDFINFE